MADGSNLKAKVGMDTGDFEKGAKKVAKAAQSMGKDMTTSLTDVGKAIGVDTGLLGDMAGRIQNATTLFRGMGSAGGGAASSLTTAMTGLAGAIAGLGITAAITAFKQLNAQANTFRDTMEGIKFETGLKAYRDTYNAVIEDQTGTGKAFAKWWGETKKDGLNLLSKIGTVLTMDTIRPAAFKELAETWRTAEEKAEKSRRLEEEIQDIERNRLRNQVEWQALQREALEMEREATDNTVSKEDRQKALNRAVEIYNELYGQQAEYAREISDRRKEQSSLATDSASAEKESIQAQSATDQILGEQVLKMRRLQRLQNSINSAAKGSGSGSGVAKTAKETAQAAELTLEAATELVRKERELKAIQDQNAAMKAAARFGMADPLQGMSLPGNLQRGAETMTQEVLLRPVVDTEATRIAIMDLTSTVTDGVIGMSDAIGSLIADLINGENAWGNFAQAGISVVADMLSTVGKAFITEGIGVEAAQMALKTGNGLGAIAAGGAMVALAAAMRTAMSNASANWSGGGSSVASSAYSGGSSNTPTAYGREMTVHVTGTLTGEGSKLVAVLNNEADRKRVTT